MFNIAAMIPSLIGMGADIAGSVGKLKKPKKGRQSALAAQRAGAEVQKSAIGGAQSGTGTMGGLNLRTGLRAASQAALDASGAMAAGADADERRFQEAMDRRNENVASFAKGISGGLANMTQALVGPEGAEDGGLAREERQAFRGGEEQQIKGADVATKAMAEPETGQTSLPGVDFSAEMADQDAKANALTMAEEVGRGDADLQLQDPSGASALDRIKAQAPQLVPRIEEGLETKLQMKNLMLSEAERMGIPLESVIALTNRRLGLTPGQSTQNPFGVSLGFEAEDLEGEQ
jgi:hypothetical protein